MRPPLPRLVLITDPDNARGTVAPIAAALAGTSGDHIAVQLRAKRVDDRTLCTWAHRLREVTKKHGALLLINGRADIALAVGADGVQLPERGVSVADARHLLGAKSLIGASRHDLVGVKEAASGGADFVLLAPVFDVPGKNDPLGVDRLASIAHGSPIPVIALGGINSETAPRLCATGAAGIAVRRCIHASARPATVVRNLLEVLDNFDER